MRTTLILRDDLLKQAMDLTGIKEKTAVIHAALESLIQKKTSERLIALAGTQPDAQHIRRRR